MAHGEAAGDGAGPHDDGTKLLTLTDTLAFAGAGTAPLFGGDTTGETAGGDSWLGLAVTVDDGTGVGELVSDLVDCGVAAHAVASTAAIPITQVDHLMQQQTPEQPKTLQPSTRSR